ncbi:MAG: efflux RND transporter periplasmic adaptor subunit, partial [Candidatus Fervidibacter sp.]
MEIAQQELQAAKADLTYWEAEIERAKTLYGQKVISKDEFQREEVQFETAKARVKAAEAKVRQAQAMVRTAEAKLRQARTMVKQKEAELTAVKERVSQTQAMVEMAQARPAQMKAMDQAAQAKVRQAKAALQAAQAKVNQAQAKVIKAQAMVQEAVASVKRGGRHVMHSEALKAQMQAMLTEAKIVRGYTEIRSLTDGYVMERLIAPGTLVTAGTPILRIAQLDKVRVQAFVSEKDLTDIHLSTPVVIKSVKDGKQWTAKVTSIFPSVDPTARTGLVEAIVDNAGLRLLPGQSVIVDIRKRRISNTLTVPNEAITQFNGQPAVWIAMPMGESGPIQYTCPMHPNVISEKPGCRPKCGMDLVPT